jgi:hypothetical protein
VLLFSLCGLSLFLSGVVKVQFLWASVYPFVKFLCDDSRQFDGESVRCLFG